MKTGNLKVHIVIVPMTRWARVRSADARTPSTVDDRARCDFVCEDIRKVSCP